MNGWNEVSWREKKQTDRRSSRKSPKALSEADVYRLLSTYKTLPCQNQDIQHDPRSCAFYHTPKDRRRDPYASYYTVDEAVNTMEQMFHPVLFRTTFCQRGNNCPFRESSCSYAHTKADLRDREENSEFYEYHHLVKQIEDQAPTRQLGDFLPDGIRNRLGGTRNVAAVWEQLHIPTKKVFEPLNQEQLFLIRKSISLFNQMQDFAFYDGLARVALTRMNGKSGILLTGLHVGNTLRHCLKMLEPPSDHFAVESRDFGERIVDKVRTILHKKPDELIGSSYVLVQVLDDTQVRFIGVHSSRDSATKAIQNVITKIEFWMSQEGYDEFVECCCCMDEKNLDEGVRCGNGHFICSERCLELAVESQVVHIQSREGDPLVCPMCNCPYPTQTLAAHLPPATWDRVQKAIVDQRVERERKILQKGFDARLKEQVDNLISKYGQASEFLRTEAKLEAQQIRNTIMNLACPHCDTAYFEFDGCMALSCATCKMSFCGYCHHKTETSRGAHEHVRQCLMNTTPDGSYYADKERVREAQRQYRTRELKKYLCKFKKDKQNAIVIELKTDLKDVNIQAEALYEVGNLQGEL